MVFVWIIVAILVGIGVLLVAVLNEQKKLDDPYRGLLLVDKQDEDGPAMVYLQALVDPGTFRNGETVKLRVRIVQSDTDKSQRKQG